jgi:hypothetical protein
MDLTSQQKTTLLALVNAEIADLNDTHMLEPKIQALVTAEKDRLKEIVEALSPPSYYR